MLDRGLSLLLSLAVLATTGVASGTPCCTLLQLSRAASAEIRDCCESPECCRVEKRGPAQAEISIKAPENAAAAALPVLHPLLLGEAAIRLFASLELAVVAGDRPPPLQRRDTRLLISLFRL